MAFKLSMEKKRSEISLGIKVNKKKKKKTEARWEHPL